MAAQAGAGLLGLGAAVRKSMPRFAASTEEPGDVARQAQEDLSPTPRTGGAQAVLGALGEYADAVKNRLRELPGAVHAERGWSSLAETSPMAGAAALAAANVFGGVPKGVEGAALSATERAAAEQAAKAAQLRAIAESEARIREGRRFNHC